MVRRCLVLMLLVLAAPLARADDLADEAEFRFRRGAELYAKRDYAGALSEFFTSNRLVHNRNVVFNIARTLEQLGRVEEAYRYYAGMLEEGLPEADRREVDTSLRRLSARLALVRVESDPPGATIFVERKDLGGLGQTPRTLALPARPTKIILELPGHYTQERAVTPVTGREIHLKIPLQTIYGHLTLQVAPAGAEVHLDREDGEKLGQEAAVTPGRHVLWARAEGYVTQTLVVEVPPEKTVPVQISLLPRPPPTGALVVRANVDGALIVIDGKESGFTPGVVEGVVAGKHQVAIEAEGREKFTREVDVAANERAFVDAHLRYAGPSVEAATKSLARATDAPGSITVITRDEIRAFGYQTLAEALRAVRGIYLTDDRTYSTLGFRGIAPLGDYNNRILILVDGHTVYDPWVDQAYVGRELDVDLDQVERIEVVRGGGSALYGTGAVFGVINVVHRGADEGAHANLEGGVGTLGQDLGRVTASVGKPSFGALATAAIYDATGEPVYRSPEPVNGQTLSLTNDAERAFHAGLRLRAGEVQLLADFNTRRKDSPTGQFDVPFGIGERSVDTVGFAELRFDHPFAAGASFTARGYYDGSRFKGTYPNSNPDGTPSGDASLSKGGADAAGGELRLQLPELARNTLSVGFEGQDRFNVFQDLQTGADPNTHQKNTEAIVSGYVNDAVRVSNWLTLTAGLRVDDHLDSFGLVLAPRAAVVAHPYEGATTKLLASRSFRAPSIYERFYSDITQVAAPDLKPEVGLEAELEHTHPLSDEASITGAVFASKLSDLIELGSTSSGMLQYQNLSQGIRSYGAEIEARYRPGPMLLVEAFYAYQYTRLENGNQIENSPAHTGAARAMIPLANELLTFATEVIYNSARLAPPHLGGVRAQIGEGLTWNAVVSGVYPRYGLRYQAGVFNVLDQRVELPATGMPPGVNVAQLGRQIRLTVGVGF